MGYLNEGDKGGQGGNTRVIGNEGLRKKGRGKRQGEEIKKKKKKKNEIFRSTLFSLSFFFFSMPATLPFPLPLSTDPKRGGLPKVERERLSKKKPTR